jgi:hypothetical protein
MPEIKTAGGSARSGGLTSFAPIPRADAGFESIESFRACFPGNRPDQEGISFMPSKRKAKKTPAADPQEDDAALAGQAPAEENDERVQWELLCSQAGLPEIGATVDAAAMFRFATRELAILARLAPDFDVRLAAAQFLFREFNSRPGGLSEKEEFVLKLRREVARAAVEEDGNEAIDLSIETSGAARLPAPAGQDKGDPS